MRILALAVSSTLVLMVCASVASEGTRPENRACTEYRAGFDRFPRSYDDRGELVRPDREEALALLAHLRAKPEPTDEERAIELAAAKALLSDSVPRAERESRIDAYARAVHQCASAREWEKWRLLARFARVIALTPGEMQDLRAEMIRYVRFKDGIPATLLDASLRISIAKTAVEYAAFTLPEAGRAEVERLEREVRAEARKLKAATENRAGSVTDAAWDSIREELPAAEGFFDRLRSIVPQN